MCETPFEITLLALFCLAVEGLMCFLFVDALITDGFNAVVVFAAAFYGASALFALFLLLGVTMKNKNFIQYFIVGTKIRIGFEALMLGAIAFMEFGPGSKQGGHRKEKIVGNIVSLILRAVARAKDDPDKQRTGLRTGRESYFVPGLVGILADCFVLWRIQVFADSMTAPQ